MVVFAVLCTIAYFLAPDWLVPNINVYDIGSF
jgi:hypothetical protein